MIYFKQIINLSSMFAPNFTEILRSGLHVVLAGEEHGPVHLKIGQEVVNVLLNHLNESSKFYLFSRCI